MILPKTFCFKTFKKSSISPWVDEMHMPKPQKYTNTFIITKNVFLVGLRVLQNISKPVETPCILAFKDESVEALHQLSLKELT